MGAANGGMGCCQSVEPCGGAAKVLITAIDKPMPSATTVNLECVIDPFVEDSVIGLVLWK